MLENKFMYLYCSELADLKQQLSAQIDKCNEHLDAIESLTWDIQDLESKCDLYHRECERSERKIEDDIHSLSLILQEIEEVIEYRKEIGLVTYSPAELESAGQQVLF